MYVGLKQPRGDGERYVTPARAAAKETRGQAGFFSDPPLARNSRFALTTRSPRFRLCSPEIRKKSRLFCRLLFPMHHRQSIGNINNKNNNAWMISIFIDRIKVRN